MSQKSNGPDPTTGLQTSYKGTFGPPGHRKKSTVQWGYRCRSTTGLTMKLYVKARCNKAEVGAEGREKGAL